MMQTVLKSMMGIALIFAVVGCGGGSTEALEEVQETVETIDQITNEEGDELTGTSRLSQELKDSITYMFDEERLAHDVYLAIHEYHWNENDVNITQLYTIATKSESEHIDAVDRLAVEYDLNVTTYDPTIEPYYAPRQPGKYTVSHVQDLYDLLYDKGTDSIQDALEVGCIVEVTDINDLDTYIAQAQTSNAPDVEEVFVSLRNGSYNHYWAFDKGLVDLGIEKGCCSLGVIDNVDYCHSEYPKR